MDYQFKVALSFATEEQELVESVYHSLRAEGINTFFAPSPEAQVYLSGKNQREIFYKIFGLEAEYVALFVSKNYVVKKVPMEEAHIAFAKHASIGSVIPIYLDGTPLPNYLLDPSSMNYFRSNNPFEIANHLASKVSISSTQDEMADESEIGHSMMHVSGNTADKQIFIQSMSGKVEI